MRPGYDLLGMAHPLFPFKRIINQVPRDCPIGWFWNQFGSSTERFKALIAQGFTIFRPQMWWSDAHAIVPMNVLHATLIELRDVVHGVSAPLKLYISPSCEHAERNTEEVKKRLDLVQQVIGNGVHVVNNPIPGRGVKVPGYLTEHHGGNPGKCDLASTDGTNIYDINAARWVKAYGHKEHPCFLWGYRFNLREISDPGQNPPAVINRRAAPDLKYFASIERLAHPKGEAPKPSFKAMKFEMPNIYKTHAEDDQEQRETDPDEPRENRPVLIIKSSAPDISIIDHTGHVLGKLVRYGNPGSFAGGLSRYYSGSRGGIGLYGYQIGEQAAKKSGSEFVWFRDGKRIYGPVHPAFRAGVFR